MTTTKNSALPELVTVGAMHKCRADAKFDQCVNCGAIAEELAKPCKAFMAKADNALHLMEGQGGAASGEVEKWRMVPVEPTHAMLDAAERTEQIHNEYGVDLYVENTEEVYRAMIAAAPVCPVKEKTSFDHWVDEVEASGEAAKHAYPPLPEPAGWTSLNVLTKKTRYEKLPVQSLQPGLYSHTQLFDKGQMHAYIDADRAAVSYELNKFKELYRLSQEGLVRERGITKELASIARQWAALDAGSWLPERYENEKTALLRATVAALSRVQHVAARGAEVSE